MLLVVCATVGALSLALPPVRGVRADAPDQSGALSAGAFPAGPFPAGASAPDGPVAEPVRLTARDGRKLEGSFFAAADAKKAVPAVLLLHDLGRDRTQLEPLVERLVKQDLAVLCFDLRGHGESADEDCDWSKLDDTERERLAPFTVLDVNAAMDWLSDDPRVEGARQHLVGAGFGGLLAARVATDERVTSLTVYEPQVERYDFALADLIAAAGGLSMQLATAREDAERWNTFLVEEEIDDLIEVRSAKAKSGELLGDKRFRLGLCRWIDERREGVERARATRRRR